MRPQRCAVFIDGFNLYHGLKASSGRSHLWLDLEGLSRDLLKPTQTLVSVTYFTAMVRDDPDALMRPNTTPTGGAATTSHSARPRHLKPGNHRDLANARSAPLIRPDTRPAPVIHPPTLNSAQDEPDIPALRAC